jgi:hypothetical protein
VSAVIQETTEQRTTFKLSSRCQTCAVFLTVNGHSGQRTSSTIHVQRRAYRFFPTLVRYLVQFGESGTISACTINLCGAVPLKSKG